MTDLSKAQLNTILSALDDQPRNPNTKDAALRAIGRHAERLGLSVEDLLATTAGLLDGRLSAQAWRAEISERHEPAEALPDDDTPEPESQPARERHLGFYAIINRAVDAADDVMAGIDDETAAYLRRRAAQFARRERRAA